MGLSKVYVLSMNAHDQAGAAAPPVFHQASSPVPGGGPLSRIAFLHIPKSAGSSFTRGLARHWKRIRILPTADALDSLDHKSLHLTLIAGHFYAHQLSHPAFEHFTPVTVLREPMQRLFSSWKFARRCNREGLPLGAAMRYSAQVPFLEYAFSALGAADRHAQLYILGATPGVPASSTPLGEVLETAKRRLRGMRVGVVDELQPFLDSLLAEAGIGEPPVLQHLLASSEPNAEDGLTAAQRQTLREVMAPDYALYDLARELMLRRLDGAAAAAPRAA